MTYLKQPADALPQSVIEKSTCMLLDSIRILRRKHQADTLAELYIAPYFWVRETKKNPYPLLAHPETDQAKLQKSAFKPNTHVSKNLFEIIFRRK